jgi:hypothetical protein
MSKKKKQEYSIEKIQVSLRIGLSTCVQRDEIEVEVPFDASAEESDKIKFEDAQEWAGNFIEVSYTDL